MGTWSKTSGTQVLIGTGLAVLPILYFRLTRVSWYPLNPYEHLIQHGLAYLFLVIFAYVNHTVFVPRWFLAKQYRRHAIVAISCLLGVALLSYRIEQWVFLKPPNEHTPRAWVRQIFWAENLFERPRNDPSGGDRSDHFDQVEPSVADRPQPVSPDPVFVPQQAPSRGRPGGPGPWVKIIIIFLVGGVGTLLSISIQTANRLRQVETDQLQAELRQLKAQIHPHFLFNTLNSIYSLAIRKDDRTADTIVKLAEFMRYVIRDAHRDKVPLVTETNYIANYLDLQQARLQEAVQVHYQVEGDVSRWHIAPLLLFTFIENAFKFGVNPEEESVIGINLTVFEDKLQLTVSNRKVQVNPLEESTGIGLKNAWDRLTLLYPGAHSLRIDDTLTHFRVDLRLTLTE